MLRSLDNIICVKKGMKTSLLASLLVIFIILGSITPAINDVYGQVVASESVSLDGEMEILIFDEHSGQVKYEYYLRQLNNGQEKRFKLNVKKSVDASILTGDKIKVKGNLKKITNVVDEASITLVDSSSSVSQTDAATVINERRAIIILVDMLNAQAVASKEQVTSLMYEATPSVDSFYTAVSRNQVTFDPDVNLDGEADVVGPFLINYDGNAGCNYNDWALAAETAAIASGVDFSKYQHRIFVLPHYTTNACTWWGLANVGCTTYCRAWIAGNSLGLYNHELGHNFGMSHSSTDANNDGTIDGEYDDLSCPMGHSPNNTYTIYSFNAPHMDQMNWLDPYPGAQTTVLTSGTYNLYALSHDSSSIGGPQIIKVSKPNSSEYYYLSYRPSLGIDSLIKTNYNDGVNIHTYKGSGYYKSKFIKELIDGSGFTDLANGVTFRQISRAADQSYVTVEISMAEPGCSPASPTVSISPQTKYITSSSSNDFIVLLTNNDDQYCGLTTFDLATNLGALSGVLDQSELSLSSGQTKTATLTLNSSVGEGSYNIQVVATDNDGLAPLHTGSYSNQALVIVDATAPTAPTGLTASKQGKSNVELAWQQSSDSGSGMSLYRIFRNGELMSSTSNTIYKDSNVNTGNYNYYVIAVDQVGLSSVPSNIVNITLGNGSGGPGDISGPNCNDGKDNEADGYCDYNGCAITKGRKTIVLDADPGCVGLPDGFES